ncbi:Hpt domain-containing protein [Pleionea sp. CnH1-48]|uniref:Hpt domain-containing protein n=1 Tax=Pleionea sp. CnH1-48 TaxID=2954494 RepID=UPI0020976156|nr:Hpt domain-containing protein [Pleionea sp. CnH1-48]MCO7225251.1 Hpt domain-containing protein [Pleionea sp. CnH1-48]
MADTNEQLALSWVRKEINKSLDQARQGLEAFAENDSDVTQIRFCISCLHQVRGTLQMLEFYGAALLAEEMEHLADAIANGKFVAKEKALEVLMGSLLQLPSYLDRVQEGRRDLPVVLLPLLNELRASRGVAPLAESAIFAPQLSGVSPPEPAGGQQSLPAAEFKELAKKFRHHYQKGLLSVMRSTNIKEGIQRMHKVLERLEAVSAGYPVGHLWWIADGFLLAIIEKGQYKDPAVHALLGKVDRYIKRLADVGNEALNDKIPDDLLKNLLYYVAKSESNHANIKRLKETFNLSDALPSDQVVEEERRRMQGPDSGAIETVVGAINDDLINVKDTLDLFVRGGDKSHAKLSALIPSLQKITDTLGILGLGIPRDVVKQQIITLNKCIESGDEISDAVVMDVAGALLFVEANLANVKPADVADQEEASADELAARQEAVSAEAQLDEAKIQLLSASQANLQKAKDSIVDFIASSFNFELIQNVPELLLEIQGGLRIIGFEAAADLLNNADLFVEQNLLELHEKPSESVMDALADIITSIEYCLENYGEIGSSAFDSVLNAAKNSQQILHDELEKSAAIIAEREAIAAAEAKAKEEAAAAAAEKAVEPAPAQEPEAAPVETPAPAVAPPAESIAVNKAPDESLIDDEVLEIFIEEAEEELESINELLPRWIEKPDDEETLTTIRRSYHTLKGSGRLVGASLAGELAWSIENMLNRVLDGTIKADHIVFSIIKEATAMMPSLVDAFSKNQLPAEGPDFIMAKAHAISNGEPLPLPQEVAPAAEPPVEAVAEPVEEAVEEVVEPEAVEPEIVEAAEETSVEEAPAEEEFAETLELDTEDLSSDGEAADEFAIDEALLETDDELVTPELDETVLETLEAEVTDELESVDFVAEDEPLELDDEVLEPVIEEEASPVVDELSFAETEDLEHVVEEEFAESPAEETLEIDAESLEEALEPEADDAVAHLDSDIDPVLLEIFINEAEGHLEVIKSFNREVATEKRNMASDELLRALHTLKGSAHMAEVAEIADLVSPLELLIKDYKQRDLALSKEFIEHFVLAESYLDNCIEALKENKHYHNDLKQQLVDEFTQQRANMVKTLGEDVAVSGDVVHRDPELLSIFLAEGMDIVSEAQELLEQWREADVGQAQTNLQAEMHTLKRGANMAVLEEVEQLASELESFFDADTQAVKYDDYYQLGSRALEQVLEYLNLAAIEHRLPSPADLIDELQNWSPILTEDIASEEAVSEEDVAEDIADAPEVENIVVEPELLPEVEESTTEEPQEEPVAEAPVEEVVEFVTPAIEDTHEEQAETIRPEDVHEAEDEIDEELLEFFLEEADELVEEIEERMEAWKSEPQDLIHVANLQRNLHTLKGSARMAGVMSAGNLAHGLEDLYQAISSAEVDLQDKHITVSFKFLDAFRVMIEELRDHGSYQFDERLLAEIRRYVDEPDAVEDAVSDSADEVASVATEDELVEDITPSVPEVVEVAAESGEVQKIELDEDGEEVLDIYLEEADEILENMDEALQVWSHDTADKSSIETLQRSLHTLKGGARLSNLTALGDLTHELESYFESVADGKITTDKSHIQFVMKGYDVIGSMVEEVRSKHQITTPAAYMLQLDQLVKGEPLEEITTSAPAPVEAETATPKVVPFTKKPEPETTADDAAPQRRSRQQEVVRIGSDQLESLVNLAGETSIFRARLDQQVSVLRYNLDEMDQAIDRLREQLRNLEIETDAQIEYRREITGQYDDFDPLEFDRYTRQQELTRILGESAADLLSVKDSLDNLAGDAETLLLQQGRVNTEMQESLMRTRMIPFDSLVPRLRRIVRQIGNELGKTVDLSISADGEMDRTVLERMIAPIEHMLRNAMDHGIENPQERIAASKPETGRVRIRMYRQGSEVFIEITDDGRGLNIDAIRAKALERELITENSELTDHELQQMIFEAGFSTATEVTQISGRGVGMDVVSSEIKQMGGVVEINSEVGKGATFTVKLPFTVSVNQALMIQVGDDLYAIPLTNIEGIVRISPYEVQEYYNNPDSRFEYAGMSYTMRYMGQLLDHNRRPNLEGVTRPLPILLLHGAEHPTAVQVDELLGSREIVVKSVGQQLSLLSGLSGATILGDGRVVLILDVPALTRRVDAVQSEEHILEDVVEERVPTVMVVDDSITVRKVTQRLLQRHDYKVLTAKDGVDALNVLHDHKPDVMLLDIEMPRMDGFELATIMRHDDRLKDLPIIMITSRTGEKHRQRAESIGVNRYMGKPYNEVDLLQTIESLLPGHGQ